MKSLRLISMLATLFLAHGTTASAAIDATGLDVNLHPQSPPPVIQVGACRVLWFGSESAGEISRLAGLGLTMTQTSNPADLSAANLVNYDVLVVSHTGPGVIGGNQAAISAFVAADNGLLIHQPNTVGAIDYAPAGFGVTITDAFWCNGATAEQATIVNGAHPVTAGLSDSDLSGDFDTAMGLGAGYTLLARNVVCVGNVALAAGGFGTGRVVFETGNDSPQAVDPGSDMYWARVFEWLCVGSQTPADQPTWGRVKMLYR